MTDLTELNTLERYLKEHDIPYRRIDDTGTYIEDYHRRPDGLDGHYLDRHQIMVYENKNNMISGYDGNWIWDAICHYGSYGHEQGLLEISGSLVDETKTEDSVEGYLFASEIIERLENEKEA